MTKTKHSLLMSAIALLLCCSMLIGSTFAWFTDSVTSTNNKIQSGTLKVDLELLEKGGTWTSIKDSGKALFDYDKWEPGYTEVKILKIENEGTLALKWVAQFVSEKALSKLANVIDVYVTTEALTAYPAEREVVSKWTKVGTVAEFVNTIAQTTKGTLTAKGTEGDTAYLGIALKMREEANNDYQDLDLGGAFDIRIFATQLNSEKDSFDENYDIKAWLGEADTAWYTGDTTKDTYVISTPNELAGLAKLVNEGTTRFDNVTIELGADIDLLGLKWTPIGTSVGDPIGSGNYFSGIFDGKNYTISNLYVYAPETENVGLFGVVAMGAEVKNVNIENAKVLGEANVGALAGLAYSTVTIDSCSVIGDIAVEGNYKVGGLIGGDYFVINNCTVGNVPISSFAATSAQTTNGYVKATYKQADIEGDCVGGVVGFLAEGTSTQSNNAAYVDVTGTRKVGGVFGSVGKGRAIENSTYMGTVSIVAPAEYIKDNYSKLFVGGVVGELTGAGCTFNNNYADVTINAVNPATAGTIVGGSRTTGYDFDEINEDGVSSITSTATTEEDIVTALNNGQNVVLGDDIEMEAATTAPYGNKYAVKLDGGILDGNGNELYMECYGDDYGIMTSGGTIKNITIKEGCRAVMIMYPTSDIVLDNVNIGGDGVLYPINTGEAGADGIKLTVTNSTLAGWTSFSNIESASFTNVKFEQGTYYNNIYGRVLKPYVNTTLTDCSFVAHMNLDLSGLANGQKVTVSNCTVDGQKVTADILTVPSTDEEYDTELFTVDLPSWAASVNDCIVFN